MPRCETIGAPITRSAGILLGSHEDIFVDGNIVAVFGAAGGTIGVNGKLLAANKWQIPAAWRAVVEKGLVKEWRVFADNKPVYDILAKSATPI